MAMINVQVKLPPEIVEKIDALRGPEIGWAQAAVVRRLVEEALDRRFSLSARSVNRTDEPSAEPVNA